LEQYTSPIIQRTVSLALFNPTALDAGASKAGGMVTNSQKEATFAPRSRMGYDLGSHDKTKNAQALVWYPADQASFITWREDNQVKTSGSLHCTFRKCYRGAVH
jgi:hypothetical protein